jgi:hypothetical protein
MESINYEVNSSLLRLADFFFLVAILKSHSRKYEELPAVEEFLARKKLEENPHLKEF